MHRPPLVLPALALAMLLGAASPPAAMAQGHEHAGAGPVVIAHDGPADGRQFAGNLAHFAAIAHGDDAIPDFHQDVPMRVTFDGGALFASTALSGHDYDGINVIDVVFPHAGTYLVEALDGSGNAVASFGGEVVPAPGGQVQVALDREEVAMAGDPMTFTFGVQPVTPQADLGMRLAPIAHTDCLFEVLRAGRVEFRIKPHTHEEMQSVDYTFQQPGEHTVRLTCFQAYPSERATLFAPVVREEAIDVLPGPPVNAVPGAAPVPPPAALNAVVQGAAGGDLLLVGTFDPYTVVGPDTLQHLVVAVMDPATGVPRQHVDFTAWFRGPATTLIASDTLHEYDGLLEFTTRQAIPGIYTLHVSADAGDWSDSLSMSYLVAPPAAPTSAGLVDLVLTEGEATGGLASDYVFSAAASTGAFAHSEIELRVVGDNPVPILMAKLHTHDDGTFPFQLALPKGRYQFQADNFPLMPEAVVVRPTSFPVDVAAGAIDEQADRATSPGQDAPFPAWIPLLLGLAVAAAWRRR